MSNFQFKANITKEEINELPVRKFEGQVHIIDNPDMLPEVAKRINGAKALGFDTETKPAFKKGQTNKIALLQLSTEKEVFLIRLQQTGIDNGLRDILASKSIKKIGVALHDDVKPLVALNRFEPNGFIDLQKYVKDFGIEDNGLKKLVANVLGFKISKRMQTSNWEAPELTQQQIEYAATDAWVCLEIYNKLNELKNE